MILFSKTKYKLIIFFLFCVIAKASAQDIPAPMDPPRLVNDFAQVFSDAEKKALEHKLRAYNDSTSTQIYVVTITDLGGYPISDYAFILGQKWGVGQANKNNGAIILIKPKTANSRGEAFIATGYGLEARINDAYAGRIIRNDMAPYFRQNNYFGGTNAAIDKMIGRLSGEFDADESSSGEDFRSIMTFIIIFLIFAFILFFRGRDQHIDNDGHHHGGGTPIFFPPFGGDSSGGDFGGGFSGGGGGDFGGGGAGGSW